MAAARRLGRPATPSEAQSQSGSPGAADAQTMPPESQLQDLNDGVDAMTRPPEVQPQGPSADGVDALSSLLAEAAPYLQS